jgi:hypothetical protein
MERDPEREYLATLDDATIGRRVRFGWSSSLRDQQAVSPASRSWRGRSDRLSGARSSRKIESEFVVKLGDATSVAARSRRAVAEAAAAADNSRSRARGRAPDAFCFDCIVLAVSAAYFAWKGARNTKVIRDPSRSDARGQLDSLIPIHR